MDKKAPLRKITTIDAAAAGITLAFAVLISLFAIRNNDIPTVKHVPKDGDLVLFPSCLFHYTTPFQSDEERHCMSFDMLP